MLGIFDSGFGGLTVLRSVRQALPDHDIVYLGDSARCPYGNRSREIVTQYTKECCTELFDRGCVLIVLACNTASAETLRELQQQWLPQVRKERGNDALNIIGVVRPLAEEAIEQTKTGSIGVVGTRSTIDSGAYREELFAVRPDAHVYQQACPLLVPLVEEGWVAKPETRKILRTYLMPLKSNNPDVLILACTHYEALHPLFRQMMGSRCTVLHSPDVIARKLSDYLSRHPEYDQAIARTGNTTFLTTGDPDRFAEGGAKFYGQKLLNTEKVDLTLAKKTAQC